MMQFAADDAVMADIQSQGQVWNRSFARVLIFDFKLMIMAMGTDQEVVKSSS